MFLAIKLCTHAKLCCLKTDYLYEIDLALNNLQRLICHKIQQTNQHRNKNNIRNFPLLVIGRTIASQNV